MKKVNNKLNLLRRIVLGTAISLLTALVSACDTRENGECMSLEELLSVQTQEVRSVPDGEREKAGSLAEDTSPEIGENTAGAEDEESAGCAEQETVWVHICGEVAVPGIYELPAGSRFYDALVAAGGFTEDADTTYYNLVSFILDGMQIEVPRKDTDIQENVASGGSQVGRDDGLININTATSEELQKLPGIGESRARDIIEYRQKCGGFESTTQIMEVSGIKEAIYEKIKDLIKVE